MCAAGAQLKVNELIVLMSKRLCQCHMKPLSAPPLTFPLRKICAAMALSLGKSGKFREFLFVPSLLIFSFP